MKLKDIKKLVLDGKKVYWKQENYKVIYSEANKEFLIMCLNNNHCIGLTHKDGKTLNGNEKDFYTNEEAEA